MNFNQNWLLAIGIAIPALFPNIAHSKPSADYICPPRDEMCQLVDRSLRRMDQKPAPKLAAKPKAVPAPAQPTASTSSTYDDSWTRWTPEQNARVAMTTVAAFRGAERVRLAVK